MRKLTVGFLAVIAVSLALFGSVVPSDLAQKNLDRPFSSVAPLYTPPELDGATTDYSTLWPTTTEGDVVVTAVGDWSYWWNTGDYAMGSRSTGISAVNQLDYHMVITENVLNGGGHCDLDFYLNGVMIGSFTVVEGEFEKNLSFTFDPIPGPDFELYMEETNTVGPGLGSFLLDSSNPGDITLYEAATWNLCFYDENYSATELWVSLMGTVLYGQAFYDGPGFPAAITGKVYNGKAFFAIDYLDNSGLRFYMVDIATRAGTTWGVYSDTGEFYDSPHGAQLHPCGSLVGSAEPRTGLPE